MADDKRADQRGPVHGAALQKVLHIPIGLGHLIAADGGVALFKLNDQHILDAREHGIEAVETFGADDRIRRVRENDNVRTLRRIQKRARFDALTKDLDATVRNVTFEVNSWLSNSGPKSQRVCVTKV